MWSHLKERLQRIADKEGHPPAEPLAEADIVAFERAHAITLPEAFRSFLLEIGAGGIGPHYPMLSPAEGLAERGTQTLYGLADAFAPPTSTDDFVELDVGGLLPISYDGCDYYHSIVVSGALRGTVWISVLDRPGWVPFVINPRDKSGKPLKLKGENYTAFYAGLLAHDAASFTAFYESVVHDREKLLGLATAAKKTPTTKKKAAAQKTKRKTPK